jgi:1-acyl-sn-glycerol-3-phosphate acyltransferase
MSFWYLFIRNYVRAGIGLYFRKVNIIGAEEIPKDGPVLFTVNHQNAFLDALLVATTNKRHTHFLARADVFKFKAVRRFFSSLNMMPIYRIRDGRASLQQNHKIFEKCYAILKQQHALMVFPEANHHQKRFLMPLSKGFTRIALGTGEEIRIIPVGLNYSHHRRFGSNVTIKYGAAISTGPYLHQRQPDYRGLREKVSREMQQLITHIPNGHHYQLLEDYLNQDPNKYLDPEKCNQWLQQVNPDTLSVPTTIRTPSWFKKLIRGCCWMLNFPPMLLCRWVLNKIGDPVFSSSIKFLTGIIIFPIYYLGLAGFAYFLFGASTALVVVTVAIFSLLLRKWVF